MCLTYSQRHPRQNGECYSLRSSLASSAKRFPPCTYRARPLQRIAPLLPTPIPGKSAHTLHCREPKEKTAADASRPRLSLKLRCRAQIRDVPPDEEGHNPASRSPHLLEMV